MKKKKIVVKGPALTASGYGEHTRFILRALRAREDVFDIYLHNLTWGKTGWLFEDNEERQYIDNLIRKTAVLFSQHPPGSFLFDYSMQVTIPNEFEKMAAVDIGVTAGIETTRVAPQWLQKVNEMDKVIVVSNHSKYGFENTKYPLNDQNGNHVSDLTCNVPVEVIGYPVRKHKKEKADFNFTTDFNFLAVALWGQRKNIVKTVENFVEEFMEDKDVGLILKTSLRSGCTYDKINMKVSLENLLSKYPDRKCKVYLLHGRLSEGEMETLYNHKSVKCMLSLAHGEGFGLPLFEAAYNGLPVVATDWSGQTDFLYAPQKDKKGKTKNKALFGKVSYDLKKVQKESVWEGVITPDSMWAYPKDSSAKEKMRGVYKDYSMALSRAKKLKTHVLKEFQEEKMYKMVFDSVLPNYVEKEEKKAEEVDGISFCISTNGAKPEKTKISINSIEKTMKNVDIPYEIVVCGDITPFTDIDCVKCVDASEDAHGGLLAKLRNVAAAATDKTLNSIVFLDDDIIFSENWASRFVEFSKSKPWTVLGNKILLPDGGRYWDRATRIPQKLVDYDHSEDDTSLYQTGCFWILRRETYLESPWDSSIPFYAEKNGGINEDVDMSKRLIELGHSISFDKENLVWHNDDAYVELPEYGFTVRKEIAKDRLGVKEFAEQTKEFKEAVAYGAK